MGVFNPARKECAEAWPARAECGVMASRPGENCHGHRPRFGAMNRATGLYTIKKTPARLVADRLEVKLAQVYYAKYTVSRLLQKEIRHLESKGL